jgi:hypothetical protein
MEAQECKRDGASLSSEPACSFRDGGSCTFVTSLGCSVLLGFAAHTQSCDSCEALA